MMEIKEQIRKQAGALGFDECRFTTAEPPSTGNLFQEWIQAGCYASMNWIARERSIQCRLDPQKLLPGAKSFICLARSYYTGENPRQSAVARYARLPDYHETLKAPLAQLAQFVRTLSTPAPEILAYTDTGPILERDVAQRAGLGFIGKHHNLIHPQLGTWFFLAELITTLEITPDPPSVQQCGTCTRCLEACPTGALRPNGQLDARNCLSYLTIEHRGEIPEKLATAMGERFFGCDRCLEACPWNRKLSPPHQEVSRQENLPLSSDELKKMDDATFKKIFSGTPFLRAKREGLLRNLLIAEKNRKASHSHPISS